MAIKRRQLYDVWVAEPRHNLKDKAVLDYICTVLGYEEQENINKKWYIEFRSQVRVFLVKLHTRWNQVNRSKTRFLAKFSAWLQEDMYFSEPTAQEYPGRPKKNFNDLTYSAKQKRVAYLVDNYSYEELAFATRMSLNACGLRDVANVVKEVTECSPDKANEIKKSIQYLPDQCIKYTGSEALSLYVDAHLSKYSYTLLQQGAKEKNANIYPPYNSLILVKKECYPEGITVTSTKAEIDLQSLLDHTANRILQAQSSALGQHIQQLRQGLTLFLKWGCDGSSDHSNYNQQFDSPDMSDSSMYVVCLVPLQLNSNEGNIAIWKNDAPSSTRFCRPIKLLFERETSEVIRRKISQMQEKISALHSTVISVGNESIQISYQMQLTMIDRKTFSVVSDTSVQKCPICKATPKTMNNLNEVFERRSDESYYQYGLSTLHAYIRFMECILHIAYRLKIKVWRVTSTEHKEIFENEKREIQRKIKDLLHINVDMPKHGSGTTNTGNTASRFFEKYTLASEATGIDEELIRRFGTILSCMSSGFDISYEKFEKYCRDTAQHYVQLYGWYPMPSSVHRVLVHGPGIIKSCSFPIGMMSEEALEARNKDIRRYREDSTRKSSRSNTMEDLIHALLFTSDPLITFLSRNRKPALKGDTDIDDEVRSLLQEL